MTKLIDRVEPDPGSWRGALALLCAAALVRVAVLLALGSHLECDPDGYRALATSLLQQGVLRDGPAAPRPSAYRSPLYPLLLVPCVASGHAALGIALLHLTCGLATVWLTWRLARRWGFNSAGRLLAATLVAIDPILLFSSAQVMTETVAALLAVAALNALTRAFAAQPFWPALGAGAVAGLAVLCRPVFLAWLTLVSAAWLALWIVGRRRRHPGQLVRPCLEATSRQGASGTSRRAPCAGTPVVGFLAGAALVLGPWVARNAVDFGRPIVTTTHGGYTLLLGNNALYYEHLRTAGPLVAWSADELQRRWDAACDAASATEELARDRVAYQMAWQAIARQPGMFAVACLVRWSRLWGVLPLQIGSESALHRLLRWGVAAGYTLELLLAAVGLWRVGRRVWLPCWLWGTLLAVSFTAVHAVYWADLRMRAPLVPWIVLVAAAAVWLPPPTSARNHFAGKDLWMLSRGTNHLDRKRDWPL